MQHAYSRYRTNEMRLYNIIHLTRKHLFNITLVPMQTLCMVVRHRLTLNSAVECIMPCHIVTGLSGGVSVLDAIS